MWIPSGPLLELARTFCFSLFLHLAMQEGLKGLVIECCAPCCSVLVLLAAAAACLLLLQFEAGTLAIVSEYLNGHLRRSTSQHIIACGKVFAGTRVVPCSSIPISYPDITCKDFPLCVIWCLGLACRHFLAVYVKMDISKRSDTIRGVICFPTSIVTLRFHWENHQNLFCVEPSLGGWYGGVAKRPLWRRFRCGPGWRLVVKPMPNHPQISPLYIGSSISKWVSSK